MADKMTDDLLEDAANGDVVIVQVAKNGVFEKLNPDNGMFLPVEKGEY